MKKLLLLITCTIACMTINAQDKKVAISSAVASCAEGSNPAELAIDGNPKTYWHTPWNGTPFSFPVTFTITLKEATHVDYIRYIPRQDGNSNGNWNVVYVAYCPTTNGNNFTNLGQYALNGAGLTYDFMLTDAGLECGLLSEKLPGLDCVSIGPNMQDIHTSRERLEIASTKRTWEFLLEVLKAL